MYGKSLIALAAIGAVNASPLQVRQASSVASSAASAASSAVDSVISAASSTVATTTATDGSADSTSSSVMSMPSSMMSSMMSSSAATATGTGAVGDERFPRYPCPAGTLLTYAEVNQTFDGTSITQLTQAAGEFATSPIFPNITESQGGNTVGATHTFNLMGLSVSEVLVNVTTNQTSGSAIWNWNNTAPITIDGLAGINGLQLANYSTVLQLYDPEFTTTGMIGNSSIAVLFTNACFSNQEQGVALLQTLGNLELGNLATAASNSTMGGNMTSSAAPAASTAASSVESGASSATSAAASGASSAASAASSVASAPVSGASSVASAATSAAAGAASSVAAPATSA